MLSRAEPNQASSRKPLTTSLEPRRVRLSRFLAQPSQAGESMNFYMFSTISTLFTHTLCFYSLFLHVLLIHPRAWDSINLSVQVREPWLRHCRFGGPNRSFWGLWALSDPWIRQWTLFYCRECDISYISLCLSSTHLSRPDGDSGIRCPGPPCGPTQPPFHRRLLGGYSRRCCSPSAPPAHRVRV